MSDESQEEPSAKKDGFVDVLSVVLIIVIPVVTVVYWLSGLPSS
ncbi:MAG: hypothetical protein ACI8Z1_003866 [Candidatus Azotimanducaceae bacterium]|jgi:hypothetical protein